MRDRPGIDLLHRTHHSSVIIGDELYIWGGDQPDLPLVHDSPNKRQFTSSVDVYDIFDSSFIKRQTTGTPHNGTTGYSCCSIGNHIYYFGGTCHIMCYHNNLFTLNTITNDWREVITSNNDEGPMKKDGCGMIPFSINHEDYVLVIGGFGPLPSHPSSHAQYIPDPKDPSRCYTNEVHIMCVSTTPGNWRVPMITGGSVFSTLVSFSINTLPGNRAIIFGGVSVNEHNTHYNYSNDVFILSYTNNSLDFVKIAPTKIQWPKGRYGHSSVVISSVHVNGMKNHYLVVLGGWDNDSVTGDCYIMNIDNKEWKQISLPKVVVEKRYHSMSCYEISVNCVWLIVTGGELSTTRNNFISSPNRLMIVELVFSPIDDEWTVTNVMNEDNMKYYQVLSNRLSRKRLSSTVTPSEEIMKDNEEQKQVIVKLQSDLQLCKEGYMIQLMEKEKRIKLCKANHLQEVERKLSGDNTMELQIQEHSQDHIEHVETIIDHSDEGNVRQKMNKQLLKENDMLRQQNDKLQLRNEELIQEMDEMRDTRDKSTKGHQLKHDQSTQFNYMTTVNDCVDNVHVGEETVYLIQGNNAQSFNWSKWGLRIHFPEDSVMADMTCEVAVKVLVGGKFQFPDGSKLVSAVYGVSFANKLQKPVKLEIQHCAVLRNELQFRRVSFVKAPMRQRVPPFEFSELEGGVFSIDSQYGSIILDHFCLIGIILVVKNIPVGVVWKDLREVTESLNTTSTSVINRETGSQDNTSEGTTDVSLQTDSDSTVQTDSHSDDDDNVDLSYTGQLYYSRHGDGHTINQWMVEFMAVKNLNALKMYLKKEFPNAKADQSIRFGFHGNNGVLELVMSHDPFTRINGWTIRPHINPLTILQKDMDKFGRDDGVPLPPSCLISVSIRNPDDTTPDLYYCVPVKGVVSNTKEIFIHRILETAPSEQHFQVSSSQGRSPHRSNEDTDVNYCEVFKEHYDSLVTAIATSCSLMSNVARALRSAKLVSQGTVDDVLAATRPQEIEQSVIKLLNEVRNFLDIAKRHPNKQKKMLMDFCRVLQTQDSPMLQFISTEVLETLHVE